MAEFSAPKHATKWYIDFSATKHVAKSPSVLHNFVPSFGHSTAYIAGRANLPIAGKANINLAFQSNEIKELSNDLYVPGVKKNLSFVGQLTDQGHIFMFNAKLCHVVNWKTNRLFFSASCDPQNKLYRIHGSSPQTDRKSFDNYLINNIAKSSQVE
jgi:hypothetical protein